jgi:hypothetical protein
MPPHRPFVPQDLVRVGLRRFCNEACLFGNYGKQAKQNHFLACGISWIVQSKSLAIQA